MPATHVIPILMMITVGKALGLETTYRLKLWLFDKNWNIWIIFELPPYKPINLRDEIKVKTH